MDWSGTEAKGLREVIGAEKVERICNVHTLPLGKITSEGFRVNKASGFSSEW